SDTGTMVDQARSTDEALGRLAHTIYQLVITDLEREENHHVNPRAGFDLVQRMKESRMETPVFVYCSPMSVDRYRDELRAAGIEVTSSPLELFDRLMPPIDSTASRESRESAA